MPLQELDEVLCFEYFCMLVHEIMLVSLKSLVMYKMITEPTHILAFVLITYNCCLTI